MLRKYALTLLVLLASFMLVAQPVAAREFAAIYEECGLGAMIAPNNPIVAVVTNVTWDLGTTAISSNVSSPETCKGGQSDTAFFIHDSYELLEVDLASGNGNYLDMLTVLAQYEPRTEECEQFLTALRADFAAYVAQPDYASQSRFQKAEALYDMVYSHTGS